MKPVIVEWIDAQRLELGVQDINEVKGIEPMPCKIIGFLVEETRDYVVLAQEHWPEGHGVKYVHSIPKRSITKITKLKE